MRAKRRARVSIFFGAALITTAGCAGPKFGSPAEEAGSPAGVHSAGRRATIDAGAADATGDTGEANGGESSALGPSNGARDAGVHDDGGALGETGDGTGGTSGGRSGSPPIWGGATGTSGSSAVSPAGAGGTGGTTEPGGGGRATAGGGGMATAGSGGMATAGSGGTAPSGGGGMATAGSGGTAPSGHAGEAAGGAPPTCAPAECPLLPPTDGAACTSCEVPKSGCEYDACLLLGSTYSARCVADAWSVTVDSCVDPNDCCANESAADCKKHDKDKDCKD